MYEINLRKKQIPQIKWACESLFTTIQKREMVSKELNIFIQEGKLVKIISQLQKLLT